MKRAISSLMVAIMTICLINITVAASSVPQMAIASNPSINVVSVKAMMESSRRAGDFALRNVGFIPDTVSGGMYDSFVNWNVEYFLFELDQITEISGLSFDKADSFTHSLMASTPDYDIIGNPDLSSTGKISVLVSSDGSNWNTVFEADDYDILEYSTSGMRMLDIQFDTIVTGKYVKLDLGGIKFVWARSFDLNPSVTIEHEKKIKSELVNAGLIGFGGLWASDGGLSTTFSETNYDVTNGTPDWILNHTYVKTMVFEFGSQYDFYDIEFDSWNQWYNPLHEPSDSSIGVSYDVYVTNDKTPGNWGMPMASVTINDFTDLKYNPIHGNYISQKDINFLDYPNGRFVIFDFENTSNGYAKIILERPPVFKAINSISGDINRDKQIDSLDLAIFTDNYGKTTPDVSDLRADINRDGAIDSGDLSLLLSNFGREVYADGGGDEGVILPQPGEYTTQNFFGTIKYAGMTYRLHTPGAKEQDAKYPLLIYLHGSGEDNNIFNYPNSSITGSLLIERLINYINIYPGDYESYVVMPVLYDTSSIKLIVDKLIAEESVDPDRIYITGSSMGGFNTCAFMLNYPELVACGVPVCGCAFNSYIPVSVLNDIPIRIYHSDDDHTVSVETSRSFYSALINAGSTNVYYEEVTGYNHGVWNYAYAQTDTLEWMYLQSK